MKQRQKGGRGRDKWLLAIAIFKWCAALVLVLVGIGFLKLMHKDIETLVMLWADQLRVDPDNRYLGALLVKLHLLDEKKIEVLSGATFGYSALFLVQGTGLFFEKRWAEYLTVIATLSFVPVELYELAKKFSVPTCVILVINLAIALFLIVKIWTANASSRH